jgi:hypothetical protein
VIRQVIEHWSVLEADWRREYGEELTERVAAGMSWRRFAAFLSGLTPNAMFRQVADTAPLDIADVAGDDPDAQMALLARL